MEGAWTHLRKGDTYIMKIFYRNTAACLLAALFLASAGCSSTTSVFPSAQDAKENTAKTADGQQDASGDELSETESEEKPGTSDSSGSEKQEVIYVDVTGAVKTPGVYSLPAGSRVFEAIALAGGAREDASLEHVNQAGILEDGQQIRIYTEEEAEQIPEQNPVTGTGAAAQEAAKVNINTARKEELMTLTGIGETRAEAILAYRQENGGFQAPEDLMQVEGIKEKTFEKLRDQITVN